MTILLQGQSCISMHLYGEYIENSVSQNILKAIDCNLQYDQSINPFSYNQTFVPRVICPLPLAIYMFKIS